MTLLVSPDIPKIRPFSKLRAAPFRRKEAGLREGGVTSLKISSSDIQKCACSTRPGNAQQGMAKTGVKASDAVEEGS